MMLLERHCSVKSPPEISRSPRRGIGPVKNSLNNRRGLFGDCRMISPVLLEETSENRPGERRLRA